VTLITNDFGEHRDLDHGLLSGSQTQERWSIHPDDPLSAKADISWQQTGGRDKWHWTTEVITTMHSDADMFYLHARLVAWENDDIVFERCYEDTIAREFV